MSTRRQIKDLRHHAVLAFNEVIKNANATEDPETVLILAKNWPISMRTTYDEMAEAVNMGVIQDPDLIDFVKKYEGWRIAKKKGIDAYLEWKLSK